jgi:hypothetical protein
MPESVASPQAGRLVDPGLRLQMEETIASIPVDEGGGASLLKILVLADLILARPVIRLVEIGVYRGRLLLPLALVMQWRRGGEVFGIDPYTRGAAEQHDAHHRPVDLMRWADEVDWEGLYLEVTQAIERSRAKLRCHLLRAPSGDVAEQFPSGSIDLLHIDGNHDLAAVKRDADLYIPRVSVGGYVVLDDASWPSVHELFERLYANHDLVFQLLDTQGVTVDDTGGNDFAVFRLRGEDGQVRWPPAPST